MAVTGRGELGLELVFFVRIINDSIPLKMRKEANITPA
jgi:hypothetical protein